MKLHRRDPTVPCVYANLPGLQFRRPAATGDNFMDTNPEDLWREKHGGIARGAISLLRFHACKASHCAISGSCRFDEVLVLTRRHVLLLCRIVRYRLGSEIMRKGTNVLALDLDCLFRRDVYKDLKSVPLANTTLIHQEARDLF